MSPTGAASKQATMVLDIPITSPDKIRANHFQPPGEKRKSEDTHELFSHELSPQTYGCH